MKRRPRPTPAPRNLRVGTPRADEAGESLRCLLLSRRAREWIGLDLASGAFVRLDVPGEPPPGARPGRSVVQFCLAEMPGPPDPARPEAARADGELSVLPPLRPVRQRRLLDQLVQADRPGAVLLGTRGPSLAYVDLDGAAGSLVLIRAAKTLKVGLVRNGDVGCAIDFGGVTQVLPLDHRRLTEAARVAAPRVLTGDGLETALGYRPGYLLVGLDGVESGHVKKAVLGVLARA